MSTQYQPYELLYGNSIHIPTIFQKNSETCFNYGNYPFEMKQKMQSTYISARENLVKKKTGNKLYYDKWQNVQEIHIDDKVLIIDHARKNKLTPLWVGPY